MILGSPQILGTFQVDGKLVPSRALSNTIPGSLEPDPRDPETETGNLETEKIERCSGVLRRLLAMVPIQKLRPVVPPAPGPRCARQVSPSF